jgi:hypothetical protein
MNLTTSTPPKPTLESLNEFANPQQAKTYVKSAVLRTLNQDQNARRQFDHAQTLASKLQALADMNTQLCTLVTLSIALSTSDQTIAVAAQRIQ